MAERQVNFINVAYVTSKILHQLTADLGSSSSKAMLASLRNSINRPLSQSIEIWPLLFENLPEAYLGDSPNLSEAEKAILTSLQLLALYQQGVSESVYVLLEKENRRNMGVSLAYLRTDDDNKAVDRRFNTLITSTTFEEFLYHLRQMVNLLKANEKGKVLVDFPTLASDLYWFQQGDAESIRIRWAKSYYRSNHLNNENKGEENND